jgi:hypothetical protein
MKARAITLAGAVLVALTACETAQDPTTVVPDDMVPLAALGGIPDVTVRHVIVCKDADQSGTFNFTLSGLSNFTSSVSSPFQLGANTCVDIGIGGTGSYGSVTINEAPPAGFVQDKVEIYRLITDVDFRTDTPTLLSTSTTLPLSATVNRGSTIAPGLFGFVVVFYNSNAPPPPDGCTLTLGFWKNHEEDWPVTSLTLGSVTYTQAQLLSILTQPVKGNGLVSLAHQLIAAKLNIASGADPSAISAAITAADAAIGSLVVPPVGSGYLSPSSVSSLISQLDRYNNGFTGPGHCSDGPSDI